MTDLITYIPNVVVILAILYGAFKAFVWYTKTGKKELKESLDSLKKAPVTTVPQKTEVKEEVKNE